MAEGKEIGLLREWKGGQCGWSVVRKRENVARGRRGKVKKKMGIMPDLAGRGEVLGFNCLHKGSHACIILSGLVI